MGAPSGDGPKGPVTVADFVGLVEELKGQRCCMRCGVHFAQKDLELAHIHRRKKFSVGEIARRGVATRAQLQLGVRGKFRDLSAKRCLFRGALEGTYTFCRPCHLHYDSLAEVWPVQFVRPVVVKSQSGVSMVVSLAYPCAKSCARDESRFPGSS